MVRFLYWLEMSKRCATISRSAGKKADEFPLDSSKGRHAARHNSRCCEITPTVFAAAERFNLITKAHARHASDYSVETR